jgi:predicted DCC family thiol-disulfide oxidoreductase YuxK
VRALDRHHRVTVVPFQQPGAPEAAGLTVAQCEAAAWAIAAPGRRYRGAAGINFGLAVALGTRLPLWLYAMPGLRQVQDRVYDFIARIRRHLPGDVPYCVQHPEEC